MQGPFVHWNPVQHFRTVDCIFNLKASPNLVGISFMENKWQDCTFTWNNMSLKPRPKIPVLVLGRLLFLVHVVKLHSGIPFDDVGTLAVLLYVGHIVPMMRHTVITIFKYIPQADMRVVMLDKMENERGKSYQPDNSDRYSVFHAAKLIATTPSINSFVSQSIAAIISILSLSKSLCSWMVLPALGIRMSCRTCR